MQTPTIIQGGMGAGVSSWRLAKAVSSLEQLGVVSGIALDVILARRLQEGDRDGSIRRAIEHYPNQSIVSRIVKRYFVPGGKPKDRAYKTVPMHSLAENRELTELCIVASFAEVFLAREGHANPVGINLLEKIQLPHLPVLYGAMLAGVSYVLMGAGIATRIPGVLDRLANHAAASYPIAVTGATQPVMNHFDPRQYAGADLAPLRRPWFLPIVSSNTLATTMLKRSDGRVDGLVIEAPTAGGHNAPPRVKEQLDGRGQPVYGEKDRVDLEKIRELGVPFWLAGGQATPEKLSAARAAGAAGVQVGTAFAFCEESGLDPHLRASTLQAVREGRVDVVTDPVCSPTHFPFKTVQLEGTLSEPLLYGRRDRVCDLGFLREAFRGEDGTVGFRCPSEPVDVFVSKGGAVEETAGRKCLCNALVSNIGHPQLRKDERRELPLLTAGDDLVHLARLMPEGSTRYTRPTSWPQSSGSPRKRSDAAVECQGRAREVASSRLSAEARVQRFHPRGEADIRASHHRMRQLEWRVRPPAR